MVSKLDIFQGDSSDVVETTVYSNGVQATGLIAAGYTGTLSLVSALGETPLVTNTMTEVSDKFRGTFTPADTAAITVGSYIGVVQIINNSLSYKKEEHFTINIDTQGYEE